MRSRFSKFGSTCRAIGITIGGAVLASTFVACGSNDDDFKYGAVEMKSAVVGEWRGNWATPGKPAAAMRLTIAAGKPAARSACTQQTFSSLEPKCVSRSTLSLTARFTSGDGTFADVAFDGEFAIYGTLMTSGQLTLWSTDKAYTIQATWADNTLRYGDLLKGADKLGTLELTGR